jgi:hypothetical protein
MISKPSFKHVYALEFEILFLVVQEILFADWLA